MNVQKHKLIWSRDVPGSPAKVPGRPGDRTWRPWRSRGPVVPGLKKSKSPGTWKSEKSRDNGNPSTYLFSWQIKHHIERVKFGKSSFANGLGLLGNWFFIKFHRISMILEFLEAILRLLHQWRTTGSRYVHKGFHQVWYQGGVKSTVSGVF